MAHHGVVIAQIHHMLAHDGIEVAVLDEDGPDIVVPGGCSGSGTRSKASTLTKFQ